VAIWKLCQMHLRDLEGLHLLSGREGFQRWTGLLDVFGSCSWDSCRTQEAVLRGIEGIFFDESSCNPNLWSQSKRKWSKEMEIYSLIASVHRCSKEMSTWSYRHHSKHLYRPDRELNCWKLDSLCWVALHLRIVYFCNRGPTSTSESEKVPQAEHESRTLNWDQKLLIGHDQTTPASTMLTEPPTTNLPLTNPLIEQNS